MRPVISCACSALVLLQLALGGSSGFAADTAPPAAMASAPACTLTGPASPTSSNPFTVRIDLDTQVIGFD